MGGRTRRSHHRQLQRPRQRGELDAIITESEAAYHEDIENASNMILERRKELKLVIITGPSSSGKTTTTIKVSERLKRAGMKLVASDRRQLLL